MKEELLEILCEPGTHAPLKLKATESRDGEVWAGVLLSEQTGAEYPVRDGILRFVPASNYTDSLGLQWNRFSKVQMDSASGAGDSRRRFECETRWTPDLVSGRWVLDGGCGCGRFAEVAAAMGARVLALDYSSAVDAARRNLGHLPNVHYVQADLLAPPLRPQSLPFAYSIGVIQHTPDPPRVLASILGLLAPGGRFAFTIYARRWYTKLNTKYLIRPVTKRMDPARLLRGIERAMPVLFPLTDVLFRVPLLGKVARFVIPVANYVNKKDSQLGGGALRGGRPRHVRHAVAGLRLADDGRGSPRRLPAAGRRRVHVPHNGAHQRRGIGLRRDGARRPDGGRRA